MTDFIAALPMYDWPETRSGTDAEWTRFRDMFRREGIEVPETLVRRNGDLPPVPGGIRDENGEVIAPDPAALPPDEFDLAVLWRHPKLLLGQTCWGPMEAGLEPHVVVVGQPSYNGLVGGSGLQYSSAIVMRRASGTPTPDLRSDPPPRGEGVEPSDDGSPVLPLELLRGKRFAYNNPDSMSGWFGINRDLDTAGEGIGIFSELVASGSHRGSIVTIAEGRADVAAIDCRSWKLAQRHEPHAAEVQVVGWTALRKGLPMITSRHTPPEVVEKLKEILEPEEH